MHVLHLHLHVDVDGVRALVRQRSACRSLLFDRVGRVAALVPGVVWPTAVAREEKKVRKHHRYSCGKRFYHALEFLCMCDVHPESPRARLRRR